MAIQEDKESEADKKKRLDDKVTRLERSEKAMNLIILNVGDHILRKLDACTTTTSTWSTLDIFYLSKSLPNRIHLQHKFIRLRWLILVQSAQKDSKIWFIVIGGGSRSCKIQGNGSERNCWVSEEWWGIYGTRRIEKKEPFNKRNKSISRSRYGLRVTCWHCKKEGNMKRDCFDRKKKMENEDHCEAAVMVEKLQEIEALTISDKNPKDWWVIDSRCSYHMTSRRKWFHTFKEITGGQVLLADDRIIMV